MLDVDCGVGVSEVFEDGEAVSSCPEYGVFVLLVGLGVAVLFWVVAVDSD